MSEVASTWAIFKNLSYVIVFVTTVEWLGFDPQALVLFTVLMGIDVVTGIVRSCVTEGCESIRSSIGIRGVLSKLLILIALFSVAITARSIGFDARDLVMGAVNVFTLAELYSILGNIHSARTGQKKVEFDAVAFLLRRVKDLLDKYLK
jgi:toxin secretion/phage lysis holin